MSALTTSDEVLAFSTEQASRLTRLSVRQLRYWDDTEFFSPEYAPGYRHGSFSRVYSFRDVVGLFVIGLLRKKYQIPLQELRRVGAYLHRYHMTPWSGLALFVTGETIVFRDPEAGAYVSTRPAGQTMLPIELEQIARTLREEAAELRHRRAEQIGKVERKRLVVHNMPVLAGTRIPTRAVWNLHQAGFSTERVIAEYPRLRAEDVSAAIAFERSRRRKKAG